MICGPSPLFHHSSTIVVGSEIFRVSDNFLVYLRDSRFQYFQSLQKSQGYSSLKRSRKLGWYVIRGHRNMYDTDEGPYLKRGKTMDNFRLNRKSRGESTILVQFSDMGRPLKGFVSVNRG